MTWNVNEELKTETVGGVSGVVSEIPWTFSKTENGKTVYVHGITKVTGDPTDPAYTPFANLTEAQVIGWVKNDLGTDGVAYYEAKATEGMGMFSDQFTDDIMHMFPETFDPAQATDSSLPWA